MPSVLPQKWFLEWIQAGAATVAAHDIATNQSIPDSVSSGIRWAQNSGGVSIVEAAEKLNKAVQSSPALRCPNCDKIVSSLSNAHSAYCFAYGAGNVPDVGLPACPVENFAHPAVLYSVEPCECKVSAEWATGFANELKSRLRGNPAKAIVGMTEGERQNKLRRLEDTLSRLYSRQISFCIDGKQRLAVDYWIVVVVDQLQRLCPGGHNMKPAPLPLRGEVSAWAYNNGLTKPPETSEPITCGGYGTEFLCTPPQINESGNQGPVLAQGTMLYRNPDNTVTPIAPHSDAAVIGVVTAVHQGKVGMMSVDPGAHVGSYTAYSVSPPEKLSNESDGYGSAYPMPKGIGSALGGSMQELKITREQDGRYLVSLGDIRQRFDSKTTAEAFAGQLTGLAKSAGSKAANAFHQLTNEEYAEYTKNKIITPGQLKASVDSYFGSSADKAKGGGGSVVQPRTDKDLEEHVAKLRRLLNIGGARSKPDVALVNYVLAHVKDNTTEGFALGICRKWSSTGSMIDALKSWSDVKKALQAYAQGSLSLITQDAMAFLAEFVSLVEVDPNAVFGTVKGVPGPALGLLPAGTSVPNPVERHVRKKRTIRRLKE